MTGEHLGDEAELFALGALADAERAVVARHVGLCAACRERVAEAELVMASLAAAVPAAEPSASLGRRLRASARGGRPRNVAVLAFAATVALAFVGLGSQTLLLSNREAAEDRALATIVDSHFNHVSAVARGNGGVTAKVLYARDGAWIFVIARTRESGTLHAFARTPAADVDLGALATSGETASLLVRPASRIGTVAIKRGDTEVATAVLHY
jgi:hypothetical protein